MTSPLLTSFIINTSTVLGWCSFIRDTSKQRVSSFIYIPHIFMIESFILISKCIYLSDGTRTHDPSIKSALRYQLRHEENPDYIIEILSSSINLRKARVPTPIRITRTICLAGSPWSFQVRLSIIWGDWSGSNRRPSDPQTDVLTNWTTVTI